MCVDAHVGGRVCTEPESDVGYLFYAFPTVCFEAVSCAPRSPVWQLCEPPYSRMHCLCLQLTGAVGRAAVPTHSLRGFGDLNSSPYPCTASTLPAEPSLQPHTQQLQAGYVSTMLCVSAFRSSQKVLCFAFRPDPYHVMMPKISERP